MLILLHASKSIKGVIDQSLSEVWFLLLEFRSILLSDVVNCWLAPSNSWYRTLLWQGERELPFSASGWKIIGTVSSDPCQQLACGSQSAIIQLVLCPIVMTTSYHYPLHNEEEWELEFMVIFLLLWCRKQESIGSGRRQTSYIFLWPPCSCKMHYFRSHSIFPLILCQSSLHYLGLQIAMVLDISLPFLSIMSFFLLFYLLEAFRKYV